MIHSRTLWTCRSLLSHSFSSRLRPKSITGDSGSKNEVFAETVLVLPADKLDESNSADVELNFPHQEVPNKLYGISASSEAPQPVFQRSTPPIQCADADKKFSILGSRKEQRPLFNSRSCTTQDLARLRPDRHVVNLPDDCDLFHTVLYYLDTGKICFPDSENSSLHAMDDAEVSTQSLIVSLSTRCW